MVVHGETTKKTDVQRHLRWIHHWDTIDQHRTGTSGDRATADWLVQEISRVNPSAQIKEFDFVRRIPTKSQLRIGTTRILGEPLLDTGATTTTGTCAPLCNDPDEGCILVLKQPLTVSEFNSLRRNTQLVGIVLISQIAQKGSTLVNADSYLNPFGAPVIQVSSEHRDLLVDAAKRGEEATLSISLDQEITTATNVQVTCEGSDPTKPPFVVMTPKSSWYTSTGERAGGLVVWLESIRHYSLHRPSRKFIFTANTGHELGHLGLDHFIRNNSDLTSTAALWVHLGANFAATNSRIRLQCNLDDLASQLTETLRTEGIEVADIVGPETRPDGEARNIFDRGGKYISILGTNNLFHHPSDRFENNLDVGRLARTCKAILHSVQEWDKYG